MKLWLIQLQFLAISSKKGQHKEESPLKTSLLNILNTRLYERFQETLLTHHALEMSRDELLFHDLINEKKVKSATNRNSISTTSLDTTFEKFIIFFVTLVSLANWLQSSHEWNSRTKVNETYCCNIIGKK